MRISTRLTFDVSVAIPLVAISYPQYEENQPRDPESGVSGGDAKGNEGGPYDEERAVFRVSRPLYLIAPGLEYDEDGYRQDKDTNCDICDFYGLVTSGIMKKAR